MLAAGLVAAIGWPLLLHIVHVVSAPTAEIGLSHLVLPSSHLTTVMPFDLLGVAVVEIDVSFRDD